MESRPGYVYVLSNPSMPDFIKIGRTKDEVTKRAMQLSRTGVPIPYVVEFAIFTKDMDSVELEVHTALESYRPNKNREFFKCTLDQAVDCLIQTARAYI